MNNNTLKYYTFRHYYNLEGMRGTILYVPRSAELFGYFYAFNNRARIKVIIDEIGALGENENINIGCGEDAYLEVNSKNSKFVLTIPMEYEKLEIPTEELLNILNEYQQWMTKYENCEIPGLIPESKLDSWVAVPKEYVKEEWWDKKKNAE